MKTIDILAVLLFQRKDFKAKNERITKMTPVLKMDKSTIASSL